MVRPLISVLVPAFNTERYLAEAVSSGLGQTYGNVEVIVVDDGSQRPQEEALAGIQDSRLTVIRQMNAGVAAARNRAARAAKGDLIALLDSDDRWLPTKLERQWQALAAGVDVVFSDLYRFRGDVRFPQTYQMDMPVPPPHRFFQELVRRNFVGLSTVLLTRRAFEAVGGFCEDRNIWEDWDLWLRLAKDYRFAHVPEALAEYRLHDSNASGNLEVLTERSLATLARLERLDPTLFQRSLRALRHGRAAIWFNLGYGRLLEGRLAEAKVALRRSLRLNPFGLPAWKSLALAYHAELSGNRRQP